MQLNPYLTFNGNAKEAFEFYKSVFGGDYLGIVTFKEAGIATAPEYADKIMHVALSVGGNMFMASDTMEGHQAGFIAGNNISLALNVQSDEEADRLYAALAEGGTSAMPMTKSTWNSYFGMLTDKFGINWMIDHSYEA